MKITIITAAYNSASTIKDTICSVNSQDYPNIEHIIIDGGSKDKTLEIVNEYAQRISIVLSEPDNGIYDAYNKGLARATGDVIGFLNSDDFYFSPTVISKVAESFLDESVDAVYGNLVYVDQEDVNRISRLWKSQPYVEGIFAKGFVPPHPTFFLRKSVYDHVGGYDTSYRLAADFQLMLKAFLSTHVRNSRYISHTLVRMRMGGATGGNLSSIIDQNKEILNALKSHGISTSIFSFALRKVINRFAQRINGFLLNLRSS